MSYLYSIYILQTTFKKPSILKDHILGSRDGISRNYIIELGKYGGIFFFNLKKI
jgi:hypothetical protein